MASRPDTIGGRLSILIGLPIGTAAVLGTVALSSLVSGAGLFPVYVRFFGDATAWLLIVFPIALWAAGAEMGRAIVGGSDPRATRNRYSLSVNAAIWFAYMLVSVVSTTSQMSGAAFLASNLALPAVLCLISVVFTPSTIARVIYSAVERAIKKA